MSNLVRVLDGMLQRLAGAGCTIERTDDHLRVTALNGRTIAVPFRLRDERGAQGIAIKARKVLGIRI